MTERPNDLPIPTDVRYQQIAGGYSLFIGNKFILHSPSTLASATIRIQEAIEPLGQRITRLEEALERIIDYTGSQTPLDTSVANKIAREALKESQP